MPFEPFVVKLNLKQRIRKKIKEESLMNISKIEKLVARALLLGAIVAVFGCSTTPPLAKPDIFWPPPPSTPRLKWVTTFLSQHDFEKTSSQISRENFLGAAASNRFQKPTGVSSDGAGRVFVVDMDLGNLKIIDFNERQIHLLKKEPWGKLLIGSAYDSRGRLYVVDGGTQLISVFNPDQSKLLYGFGGPGYFKKAAYIALNEELQRIYVTDVKAGKVVVFDMDGNHLFTFGEEGNRLGQLYGPMGIAIAPNGDVFVSENLNARIHVFDQDGKPLRHFGERGDKEWQFEGPRDLAFTSDGKLIVATARKSGFAIYDQDGTLLLFLGGKAGTDPLGFTLPTGIWVDQNDRIYITDSLNRSLTVWQYLSPKYLEQHPVDPAALKRAEQSLKKVDK